MRLRHCFADTCADLAPGCPGWAASGECQANPGFMVGDMPAGQTGKCMVSCKVCKPGGCSQVLRSAEVLPEWQFRYSHGPGHTPGLGNEHLFVACTAGTPACADATPQCAEWAVMGECQFNPGYMVGATQGGYCRASCKTCLQSECCSWKAAGYHHVALPAVIW